MTAGFSVKNSHIEDDLILVFKKQIPTVKVITVRLKVQSKTAQSNIPVQEEDDLKPEIPVQ